MQSQRQGPVLRLLCLACASAALVLPSSRGRAPVKLSEEEEEVRRLLQGEWEEWEGERPRKGGQPDISWDFLNPGWVTPNLAVATFNKSESQQETYTLRLNVSKRPMWLDLFHDDNGRERATLTIFKFEGNRLILVEGETVGAAAWHEAAGNPPGRPKGFRPAGDRRHVRRVLFRK